MFSSLRKRLASWTVAVLGALALSACGGGGGGGPPPTGGGGSTLAVLDVDPPAIPSEIPTEFTIDGRGFGRPGDPARVYILQPAGRPRLEATSVEVLSDTEIRATSPVAGVTGVEMAGIEVELAADDASSASAILEIQGPTLVQLSPYPLSAMLGGRFRLEGTGFPAVGTTMDVTFSADIAIFGGSRDGLAREAQILSATEIEGLAPIAQLPGARNADLTVHFASGAEATIQARFENGVHLDAAPGAGPSAHLGAAVAVDRDVALVGAPGDATRAGRVFVHRLQDGGWMRVDELEPPASAAAAGDDFGRAVAVSGDHALVGAPGYNGGQGAVFAFTRDADGAWSVGDLVAVGSSPSANLGTAIAMAGDHAVVGEPLANSTAGAIRFLDLVGGAWTSGTNHHIQGALANGRLGKSVAIAVRMTSPSLKYVAAAGGTDQVALYDGSVNASTHVSTWTLNRSITDTPGSGFGVSVSLTAGRFVVGASLANAAVLYANNQPIVTTPAWTYDDTLPGPTPFVWFGAAVAVRGDRVVVGAPLESGIDSGAVYVWEKDAGSWIVRHYIPDPMGLPQDGFGNAFAIGDGELFIGSPFYDDPDVDAGALYVY